MEYMLIILLWVFLGLRAQRHLPTRWRPYLWLTLVLSVSYALAVAPYRLARIASDIVHLAR